MFVFLKLCPLADQILDLYTKYDCDHLPEFVLLSWFKGYSKGEHYNHNCLNVKIGDVSMLLGQSTYTIIHVHVHTINRLNT